MGVALWNLGGWLALLLDQPASYRRDRRLHPRLRYAIRPPWWTSTCRARANEVRLARNKTTGKPQEISANHPRVATGLSADGLPVWDPDAITAVSVVGIDVPMSLSFSSVGPALLAARGYIAASPPSAHADSQFVRRCDMAHSRGKVALIAGVTGQDGAYLTELLLSKGYLVHGVKRRSSSFNTARIDHLIHDPHEPATSFFLHYGDLTDATNIIRIVQETQPDEIYNLAAQSHVQVSFETPEYTANADGLGTLRLLEALRILGREHTTRFYQASTSEMFGKVREIPQNENTPFYPRSPYAAAKVYAYWITVNYREAYGIHASNGILFNHESPIRGETFVTRKITRAVASIKHGLQERLYLGNLDAQRDWGHARDYVEGMWLMLQQEEPGDYVLATGESHSVREFVERAFALIDRHIEWKGTGMEEKGIDSLTGQVLVEIDPRYFRPTEVETLVGDPSRARIKLSWKHKISFDALVEEMVKADMLAVLEEQKRRNRHA